MKVDPSQQPVSNWGSTVWELLSPCSNHVNELEAGYQVFRWDHIPGQYFDCSPVRRSWGRGTQSSCGRIPEQQKLWDSKCSWNIKFEGHLLHNYMSSVSWEGVFGPHWSGTQADRGSISAPAPWWPWQARDACWHLQLPLKSDRCLCYFCFGGQIKSYSLAYFQRVWKGEKMEYLWISP